MGRKGCRRAGQEAEEDQGRAGRPGERAQLSRPEDQVCDHSAQSRRQASGEIGFIGTGCNGTLGG